MQIENMAPDPRLAPFVLRYQGRTADLGARVVQIALPARTEVLLEFYFATPHLLEFQKTGERQRAPWSVAVGPQTFRVVDLILSGRIDVFTVHFRASGLHALFGVSMPELTNTAIDAEGLLGPTRAKDLHERLAAADSLEQRTRLMDAALIPFAPAPQTDVIGQALDHLRRSDGGASLDRLAREGGLSERQFRRLFTTRVGTSPKRYGRILRLNAALEAKSASPDISWTDIAHRFGWFDQAHLDKDFHALAGASPSAFVRGKAQL